MSEPTAGKQPRLPFPPQQGEQVIDVCHRHWWFLWPRTILWTLFGIVPIIVIGWSLSKLDWLDEVGRVFWPIAILWLLFWGFRLFLNWYQYQRDIWVITNQRVIDSFQRSPFQHRLSTADLVNVQDMTVEKRGIVATILNFGDVICDTAGKSGQQFRIAGVPRPQEVQLMVDKERDRERKSYS